MSLAGRQLMPHKASLHGFSQSFVTRHVRPITPRQRPLTTRAIARPSTDARLAQKNSTAAPSQRREKEAILLQRYKAHGAAITATLVLQDAGAVAIAFEWSKFSRTSTGCKDVALAMQGTTRR